MDTIARHTVAQALRDARATLRDGRGRLRAYACVGYVDPSLRRWYVEPVDAALATRVRILRVRAWALRREGRR